MRDGSLKQPGGLTSYEYATIPLSGRKGLYNTARIFNVAQKYLDIDSRCSTHVHIGGYKPTAEYATCMYATIFMVQDELFSLFPKYFKDTSQFKEKSYCGPVPKIDVDPISSPIANFGMILSYLSGKSDGKSRGNGFSGWGCGHPLDPGGDHKWQISLILATLYSNVY